MLLQDSGIVLDQLCPKSSRKKTGVCIRSWSAQTHMTCAHMLSDMHSTYMATWRCSHKGHSCVSWKICKHTSGFEPCQFETKAELRVILKHTRTQARTHTHTHTHTLTCIVTSRSSTITSLVRKSAPIVALYCDVNFLLTYWFIREVLPTLGETRNT